MKKILLLTFFVGVSLSGMAQNTNAQIQKIRDFYNLVQQQVKEGYSIENPIGTAVIDHVATYSAVGFRKGKTEIYTYLYDGEDFDSELFNTQQVVFIREQYARGAWEHYNEFLYDEDTREPIFCLFHFLNSETMEPVDKRFYFSKGKLIKAIPADAANQAKEVKNIAEHMYSFGRSVFEDTGLEIE